MATTPMEYFVGRGNQRMVRLLEQNQEVSEFFYAVLQHLVDHANATGRSFADLRIRDPFVSSDGYIRARVI